MAHHVTARDIQRIEHKLDTLIILGEQIMSAISDFATAQNAFNDQMDASISGLNGDIANLNAQIAALQASAGQITPADQALLDGIQARGKAMADKLSALDALTPPVPPVA